MTFAADPYEGLPDPDTQAHFYADVPAKRFIAWVADTVLIALITLIVIPFTAFTALFFLPVLYMVIAVLYRSLSLARRSATPGMRLVAIEFRCHDGARLDPVFAVIHTLAYTVSVSMVLPQVISVIMMLTTPRGQGLTDLVLGTVAINRPAAG